MSKKRNPRSKARRSRRQNSSLIIPAIVVVVVLAIVVGVILSIEGGEAAPNTSSLPFPDVPRISVQETRVKLEKGQALLVDVRSQDSYNKSHAAGAVSIPEEEMTARLNELPRDKDIILYCT